MRKQAPEVAQANKLSILIEEDREEDDLDDNSLDRSKRDRLDSSDHSRTASSNFQGKDGAMLNGLAASKRTDRSDFDIQVVNEE